MYTAERLKSGRQKGSWIRDAFCRAPPSFSLIFFFFSFFFYRDSGTVILLSPKLFVVTGKTRLRCCRADTVGMKKGRGEKREDSCKSSDSGGGGIISGSGGALSPLRFEALRESHIHINTSWMCPLLGWSQSCTKAALISGYHNSSMSTRTGKGRGAQVGRERRWETGRG